MARRSGYKYASYSGTLTTSAFLLAFGFLGVAYSFGAAVGLQRVVNGLNQPVFATFAPGDKERLFVLERTGTIKIVNLSTETIISTPFLSVPDTDSSSSEEGLLGLAFHPDYATNGKFYINVTVDDDGGTAATRTHIREYTVSENPEVANAGATELLTFNQPQSNHNGGWIGFSPNDGYLYIMTGDGGNGNDTGTGHTAGIGNSQDITSNLLGKALRIDVDGTNGTEAIMAFLLRILLSVLQGMMKSGLMDFEIPIGQVLTDKRGTSGSGMSGKALVRRSISNQPPTPEEGTTAGEFAKDSFKTQPIRMILLPLGQLTQSTTILAVEGPR